jgi:DNA-binding winged helix-turn-helix (wHTH) protein
MRQTSIDEAVLEYIENHAYRVVTKDELLEHIWKGSSNRYNTVVACIHRLRRRGYNIKTKHTLGYITY